MAYYMLRGIADFFAAVITDELVGECEEILGQLRMEQKAKQHRYDDYYPPDEWGME